jgi:acyl dehydratase
MKDTRKPLSLEDLEVGQRFETDRYALSAAQIQAFAAQFDPQPFHLDDAAARATIFGGLAASGWHTAAITMRLQVESGLRFANGWLGAGGSVEWPNPTRPGDVLRVRGEIVDIHPSKSRPDRGIVTVRSETLNQDGAVVQKTTAKLVVLRRPAPVSS